MEVLNLIQSKIILLLYMVYLTKISKMWIYQILPARSYYLIAKRWSSLRMIMTKIIIMMIIVSAQGWVFSPGGDQGGSEGKVLHSVTQPTPLDLTSRSTAKLSRIQPFIRQKHCKRFVKLTCSQTHTTVICASKGCKL